jgi:uncharacterized protein with HXXEE motif
VTADRARLRRAVVLSFPVAWRRADDGLGPLPAVLAAYTAHGATHVLQSAVLRGYTPGVATVPLVIAPYSAWAWWTLRRAGVDVGGQHLRRDLAVGGAVAFALAFGGQLAGRLVDRRLRRAAQRRSRSG